MIFETLADNFTPAAVKYRRIYLKHATAERFYVVDDGHG